MFVFKWIILLITFLKAGTKINMNIAVSRFDRSELTEAKMHRSDFTPIWRQSWLNLAAVFLGRCRANRADGGPRKSRGETTLIPKLTTEFSMHFWPAWKPDKLQLLYTLTSKTAVQNEGERAQVHGLLGLKELGSASYLDCSIIRVMFHKYRVMRWCCNHLHFFLQENISLFMVCFHYNYT